MRRRARQAGVGVAACLFTLLSVTAAGPAWTASGGDVRVTCPLTLGGSFEARTTSLTGEITLDASRPPSYAGSFSVDLRTLDTGIGLRNEHLRGTYLEVGKGQAFERATLSGIRLGEIDPGALRGRTSFAGTLVLHGVSKPIAGHVEFKRHPSGLLVNASFPVTLVEYGIAKPQYLGVGVKNQVQLRVSFLATTPAGAQPK